MEEQEKIVVHKRPRIIGILTILSIFGSVYFISSSIGGISDPSIVNTLRENLMASFDDMKEVYDEDAPESEQILTSIEAWEKNIDECLVPTRFRKLNIFWLIANVCTLIGAMAMRRMRKAGFHFYLGGTLIAIIGTFLAMGFGITAWAMSIPYILFGGVFSIIYGFKLKLMR